MGYTPNALPNIWAAIATPFSITSTYAVDDYCRYDGVFYKCITAIETAGAWDASKWTQVTLASQLGGSGSISWAPVAADYASTATYDLGDYAIQEGKLYKANQAISTPEAFTPAHWTQVAVTDEMNNLGFVAADFDTTEGYDIGDYVIYNDELYKAKAAVSAGAWDSSKWDKVAITDVMIDNLDIIADEFDLTASYDKGDYVIHEGKLYQAKNDVSAGVWVVNDWRETNVTNEYFDVTPLIPEYDPTVTYDFTALVWHEGKLYMPKAQDFNVLPITGAWDDTKWTEVTLQNRFKVTWGSLAQTFDKTETYEVGDFVEFRGQILMKCDANSYVPWTITDFMQYYYDTVVNKFDSTATYEAGDYVYYVNSTTNKVEMYKAKTDLAAGDWDDTNWDAVVLTDELHRNHVIDKYNPDDTYYTGERVIHGDELYVANDDGITGTWDSTKWDKEYVLNLGQNEWSEDAVYSKDDIVLHNGQLYRAVYPKTGEFSLENEVQEETQTPTFTLSAYQSSFDLGDFTPMQSTKIHMHLEFTVAGHAYTDDAEAEDEDMNFYSFDSTSGLRITLCNSSTAPKIIWDQGTCPYAFLTTDTMTGSFDEVIEHTSWSPIYDALEVGQVWDVGIRYHEGDIVQYKDSLWKAVVANTTIGTFCIGQSESLDSGEVTGAATRSAGYDPFLIRDMGAGTEFDMFESMLLAAIPGSKVTVYYTATHDGTQYSDTAEVVCDSDGYWYSEDYEVQFNQYSFAISIATCDNVADTLDMLHFVAVSSVENEWEHYYISASDAGTDAYNLAEEFDETKRYALGDKVVYDDKLWQYFATKVPGAWNQAYCQEINVETELLKELQAIASALGLTRTVRYDSGLTNEFIYTYSLS